MPRAGVWGGAKGILFALQNLSKCVGFSRVIRPQEPGFITNMQGKFFCKLVEVCGSCYESSSEVSYYLCAEIPPLEFSTLLGELCAGEFLVGRRCARSAQFNEQSWWEVIESLDVHGQD